MNRRFFQAVAAATALALAGLGLAACSPASSSTSASGSKPVLRVAAASGITTMNPVLNGTGIPVVYYFDPAYEPLINKAGDGTLKPGLATSWKYIGTGSTLFELKLRTNAKFSDGTPVNANAVKTWMEYFRDAPGSHYGTRFKEFSDIEVVDDHTLHLHLSTADASLPLIFTQDRYGYVISPKATANPSVLGTTTDGAGPYKLDPSATTIGTTYTYVPNKYYFDKSRQNWSKIVVTVSTDPNATLSALESGQEDLAVGQAKSADAASAAGLTVKSVPYLFDSLVLMDRSGELTPALGDVRVRQALNYAVDRTAIEKAVFGKYGQANVSMLTPAQKGYSDKTEKRYSYDPAKAKQLLAEAGYPNGFTMDEVVWDRNGTDETVFAQAVAGYLSKIGVKANLITNNNTSTVVSDILAKKYASWAFFGQVEDPNMLVPEQLLPHAGVLNAFNTDDKQLQALYAKYQSAPASEQTADLQALQAYIVDQAYYLQVGISDNVYFTSKSVAPIDVSAAEPIVNIVDMKPASGK